MNSRLKVCAAAIAALVVVGMTPIEVGATFPGDNGRIIFNRVAIEKPTFLVSMEPDGSDATLLTARSRNAFGASWDPDGSRFIYSRQNNDGSIDLFMRNADGSNPTRVTNTIRDEFQVAFGPDGNQAVYQRCGRQCDLFTIDLTTGDQTRVTDTQADEIAPEWSVDNLIVFERVPRRGDIDLYSIHPDGTAQTRLTANPRQEISASWSPDGTRIVFSRCGSGFEGRCDLFTMDPDGSGKDRITDTRADEFGAHFSPNGSFFVVTRSRGEGAGDLFRIRTNGRHPHRLTNTPNRFEVDADWQPLALERNLGS